MRHSKIAHQNIPTVFFKYSSILWVAVFVFLWQYFSATMYDDFPFLRIIQDTSSQDYWACKGEYMRNFHDAAVSAINHYKLINGRLTDIIMIMLVPMPQWLSSMFIGLVAGFMMWTIYWFADGLNRCRHDSWIYWAVAAILWLWFPWNNNFVSLAYKLNYVLPSVFAVVYAKGFLFDNSARGKGALVLFSAMAFITGLLHEGFSLPLIGASFIICLLDGFKNKKRLLLIAVLILGSIICVFAPSTLTRLSEESEERGLLCDAGTLISGMKVLLVPMLASIVIWGVCCYKRGKSIFKNDITRYSLIFWICSFVIGVAMAIVLNQTGRIYWCALLSLLMSDLVIIKACDFKRDFKVLSVMIMILCIVWSVFFIKKVIHVADNQKELLTILEKRNDGRAYINMIRQQDIPWWTLRMIHQYGVTSNLWNGVLDSEEGRFPLIIPYDFRGTAFEEWPKIEGDNPFRGFGNHWYSRNKIAKGTRFKAALGERTSFGLPLKPTRETMTIEAKESFFVITEQGDSVWITDFDFPYSAELLRLDY